jgi:hypothetical protein
MLVLDVGLLGKRLKLFEARDVVPLGETQD